MIHSLYVPLKLDLDFNQFVPLQFSFNGLVKLVKYCPQLTLGLPQQPRQA